MAGSIALQEGALQSVSRIDIIIQEEDEIVYDETKPQT